MGARDVDRAAPARVDRHAAERREHPVEVGDRHAERALVVGEPWPDRAGEVRLHAPDPVGDAPVRCRAQVVERGAVVGDAEAIGPMQLVELLGRRRRQHDVAPAHRDRPPEPLHARGPGVQRKHGCARTHGPFGRLGNGRGTGAEPRDGRALVDPDASLHRDAAHAAGEACGLGGRAVLHVHAAEHHRGIDPRAGGSGIEHLEVVANPQPVSRDHLVGPRPDLRLTRGDPQGSVGQEPGVDPVRLAEGADRGHALVADAADAKRHLVAVRLREVRQVVPEAADEPAVAPARPTAADVLLEDHDVGAGVQLLQVEGGPQARVAAAQDHDVGRRVAVERRRRLTLELGARQRLAEPPAPPGVGGHGEVRIGHRRGPRL